MSASVLLALLMGVSCWLEEVGETPTLLEEEGDSKIAPPYWQASQVPPFIIASMLQAFFSSAV